MERLEYIQLVRENLEIISGNEVQIYTKRMHICAQKR